jgi:hypothetical protein
VCVEDSLGAEICEYATTDFSIEDGGATTNYEVLQSVFNLQPTEDYVVTVRAINNYGNAADFTQGIFSTDDASRQLLRASNATAARELTEGRFLLIQSATVVAFDREFTFNAVGYNDCCEVRVQTNADNCESEVVAAECCTYIDCPEVPEVECNVVVTGDDDASCVTVVAEWDAPASGNVDHISGWNVASTETTIGKFVCGTSETACGLIVPYGGLEVCDTTVEDFCTEGGDSTTLWQVCTPQCQAMYDLVDFFSGVIVHE